MDPYARELARIDGVSVLETDVYEREAFGLSSWSPAALRRYGRGVRFIRALEHLDGPVHLPNQHLGRYAVGLQTPYTITIHDLFRYVDGLGLGPTAIARPTRRDRRLLAADVAGAQGAAHLITPSQYVADDVRRMLGPRHVPPIAVIPLGFDPAIFHPGLVRPPARPYVLYVGSHQRRKNLPSLLAGVRELVSRRGYGDLELVLAGRVDTDDMRATESLIGRLNLRGHVRATGPVALSGLADLYRGACCLVQLSTREGFGLTPLEALGCACPVVVSDVGALAEIYGTVASTVDPGSPGEVADAIQNLLSDGEERRDRIESGLAFASARTWDAMRVQTAAFYSDCFPS
jgi:glycosyltransferase involved in cell wall biosynthesis